MDGCQGATDEEVGVTDEEVGVTVAVAHGYAWVAGEDGIAHAVPSRGRHVRALCGVLAIDQRWARPAVMRCPDCKEVIARRHRP